MQEWLGLAAFGVSLVGLLIASFTDLRSRTVDDRVSYGLIVIGLVLFALNGFLNGDWNSFVWSVGAGILAFAGGYILWRVGFWAGGDVKLFTGLAVLNPANWILFPKLLGVNPLFPALPAPFFPVLFFFASVLALLPLSMAIAAFKLSRDPARAKKIFPNFKTRLASTVLLAFFVAGLEIALKNSGLSEWFVLPLILLFGFSPLIVRAVLGIVLGLAGIWLGGVFFWPQVFSLLAVLVAGLVVLQLLLSGSRLFRTKKPVLELEEGDIPAVDIVETETGFELQEEKGFLETIKNLKTQGLVKTQTIKRVVCSSRRAGGLEQDQIRELKSLAERKKIPAELELKESTAFVPALLAAYLVLNAIGDPIWFLI